MVHQKTRVGRAISVLTSVLLCASLAACSGMDNISHKVGDHFENWRIKYNPHAFAPSKIRDQNETCPPLATDPDKPDLENCTVIPNADGTRHWESATEGGYAGGLGPSVVHAAGFVAGMAVLGSGISKSGSNINQTGGGGGGATQSQLQGQDQHQTQGQGQFQPGRDHDHR